MVVKREEMVSGKILKFEGGLIKFIKFTPCMIKYIDDYGWERSTKIKSGWNFRFDHSDFTEREFNMYVKMKKFERSNEYSKNILESFKEELAKARNEIAELKKKPKLPMWFRIKPINRNCTNDFIKDLVKAIQPYSDSIFLSWGTNNESNHDKFPIAFNISQSQFSCNENYLSGLLEAIQPYSHIIHIDYGRN